MKFKLFNFHKKSAAEKAAQSSEPVEEKKEYLVAKYGIMVQNLPFEPSPNEVIYLENTYNEATNRCISENLELIRTCFARVGKRFVYLLFLKHPEGIPFKNLMDYRDELSDLYTRLKNSEKASRKIFGNREVKKSIEALTNPLSNSINEKCTRIKEAFLLHFHESIAERYYVTGARMEPKKVTLPTELIIWGDE